MLSLLLCFFSDETATTEIYTLSLHDALPICERRRQRLARGDAGHHGRWGRRGPRARSPGAPRDRPEHLPRSEEHTSELQSLTNLVCRLLLEKKKKKENAEMITETQIETDDIK